MDGTALKLVACALMLTDHIGAEYFPYVQIFRNIGRLAFPLFAMLAAEGAVYTRDRKKYAVQLLIFGLLSEIPYDLVRSHFWCDWDGQNVMFNFLLGALAVWVMEERAPLWPLYTGALVYAAELMRADYGAAGTLFVVLCACCRGDTVNRMAGFTTAAVCLAASFGGDEWFCLLSIPIALFYNGKPGKRSGGWKWFFYVFYPVHLTLLHLGLPFVTAYRIRRGIPF